MAKQNVGAENPAVARRLHRRIVEFMQGMEIIQIFDRAGEIQKRMNETNRKKYRPQLVAELIVVVMFNFIFFIESFIIALVLYFGTRWAGAGAGAGARGGVGVLGMFGCCVCRGGAAGAAGEAWAAGLACVFVASASFWSSMRNSPFSAYLRA